MTSYLQTSVVALTLLLTALVRAEVQTVTSPWTSCNAPCDGGFRTNPDIKNNQDKWTVYCNVFGCNFEPTDACPNLHLMFVIDQSESMQERNFWQLKQFMMDLVTYYYNLNGSTHGVVGRITIIKYDVVVQSVLDYMCPNDLEALRQAIWDIEYDPTGQGDSALLAIDELRKVLQTSSTGMTKVATFLTDGGVVRKNQVTDRMEPVLELVDMSFSIGIGNNLHKDVIADMASDEDYVHIMEEDKHYDTIFSQIMESICSYPQA